MKRLIRISKVLVTSVLLTSVMVSALFGYRDKPLEELKEKYAQSPSAFIKIDGMDVHYRDEGNVSDTLPLVLIHGTGSSLHTFDEWVAALKNDKRVVRMDIPAFGLTGPFPDRDYALSHYVVFIEHFLQVKGIKRCILGGNSLGGQIAWYFTAKNPDIVEKLILIDALGYTLDPKSVPIAFTLAQKPVINKLITFITPRFLAQSSVENVYDNKTKVSESLVDRYFELTLREGNRQALVDRMDVTMDTSGVFLIKNIQTPTLVLWGENDMLVPVLNAYLFHNDLPNDTLVIFKNVGHVPMEESPKESLEAVLTFLRK
jgi:pimeloyl-ACP methyl ester carboxylesterase